MRKILLFLLIASASMSLQAQSIKYKKLKPAVITDAGEVMSTYQLSEDEMILVKNAAKKVKANPDYIVEHAKESGWPKPLSDFDYRIDHPDEIKALNVRILTELQNGYVVMIPKKENTGSTFKLKEDIFMVFTKNGIQAK